MDPINAALVVPGDFIKLPTFRTVCSMLTTIITALAGAAGISGVAGTLTTQSLHSLVAMLYPFLETGDT